LRRQVAVTYQHFLMDQILVAVGEPHLNLPDMLYLRLADRSLHPIPKALVRHIEGRTPMPAPTPLEPHDPKFERIVDAILKRERVRVVYLQQLRPDPAITDETLNKHGLQTTVEGRVSALDHIWLELALDDKSHIKQGIPRAKIIDIEFLGPAEAVIPTEP
jgi:hypothetical protein